MQPTLAADDVLIIPSNLSCLSQPPLQVRGNDITIYRGSNTADPNDASAPFVEPLHTPEVLAILQEIQAIKQQDDASQLDKLLQLQQQLDGLTHETVTRSAEQYPGTIVPGDPSSPPLSPEDINNVLIYNTGTSLTHGLAIAVEQRGTTAGTIWAAVAHDSGSSADKVRLFRSTNDGLTWSAYAIATLGGTDQIPFDHLDMEILEPAAGEKYIYVFYTFRSNGGTGDWRVGGFVVQSPTFAGNLFALSWPGASSAHRYYRPRITSDNAYYPSIPYIYIVASFDSAVASGRHNYQVYARCVSPYTVSPTFSYTTGKFYWQTTTPGSTLRDLHADVAYFRNGSDSIIVSYSNLPDSTRLFFAKAPITGTTGNPTAAGGSIGGSNPSDAKQFAVLSSNGSDNGSVICVFRQFTGSIWNVKYFRTTNYGNFNTIAGQSVLWGSAANMNYQPDIVGVRNGNKHYFTFETSASTDSVHYVSVTTTGGTTHIQRMNGVASTSETQGPKAAFRYVNDDSCLVIYSPNGPYSAWAAGGCSGNLLSAPDEPVPADFVLYQNYPNPFNPTTHIRFAVPVRSHVLLTVYDVLGRQIAVPANDERESGTYTVDFDASRLSSGVYFYRVLISSETRAPFSSTKKMLIMK